MTQDFDPHYPSGHVTRDGRKAIFIAEIKSIFPLLFKIESHDGNTEKIIQVKRDGRFTKSLVTPNDILHADGSK